MYNCRASPHCRRLLAQRALSPRARAFPSALSTKPASNPVIAMTTSNSIRVKAARLVGCRMLILPLASQYSKGQHREADEPQRCRLGYRHRRQHQEWLRRCCAETARVEVESNCTVGCRVEVETDQAARRNVIDESGRRPRREVAQAVCTGIREGSEQ